MARLTSDFFVSHLMRRVAGEGGFATIAKKGALEAGAIYIAVRQRTGKVQLFSPAAQQYYQDERPQDRLFSMVETVSSDEDINKFVDKETRFDPDFWLVELEIDTNGLPLPFDVTTPC
jgi:hypothetical protein